MEFKSFAKTNINVSRLGFGCWGIGKSMWIGAEDAESKRALHRAINEGVNFFDTALVYGDGHSEQLVGKVEKESGKELFIATKVPSKKMEWPAKDDSMLADSFPTQYIIKQTERSLRNLNREYVDLQQFHVWNDKWAGQDEWKEAVYRLKKDGKVRYFGISINDHEPANGIEAGKTGLIDCFQVIFNLFDQAPMDELLPFCLKNNIAVLARVPLDEGGLTGNINSETEFPKGDWRHHYFRGDRKKQVADRVTAIQAITGQHCSTPAESALRFIVSFDAVTSVIPGMRSERNLLSNVNAIERGKLPDDIIEELKTQRWIRNFYK